MQCIKRNAFKFILGSLSIFLATPNLALAKEYFDPGMLNIGDGSTKIYNNEDLSLFNDLDSLPGEYKLDITINNNRMEHRSIYLYASKIDEDHQQLAPCFQANEFEHYGVNIPKPVSVIQLENGQQCVDWASLSYAKSELDLHNNQLVLQFPQAQIVQERIDYFERKYWDNGIPAFRLDYNISEFSNRNNSKTENSTFASLQSGINWGAWRFKQDSTWSHDTQGNDKWKNLSTTLSRNIPSIDSEIVLGNNYSSSAIFEGVKLRGAILQTDRTMRARRFNSYAPGITGIADSESIVSVYQNNNLIFKKSVPAGPFYITDYNPLSNGGNMTVEITGVDGQVKRQIIPFTSLAFLERKGNLNYHVALGRYDGEYDNKHEFLTQAEVIYGLTDYVTMAAGAQLSQHYQAFSFGQGINLGKFGAISANVIHAVSDFENNVDYPDNTKKEDAFTKEGNAFKLNYSKSFTPTNTSLNFAGYKYFSSGFYNFNDVMRYNSGSKFESSIHDPIVSMNDKIKHQYNVTMVQTLPNQWGSVSLNATSYNYRDRRDLQSYNLGYMLSRNKINYGLYYTYYNDTDVSQNASQGNYSISFNISMPLFTAKKPVYASYNVGRSVSGQNNHIVQLNGLAGDRLQASWNIYQGYDDKNYGGVSGSYNSPFAHFNAGYSYRGSDQHSVNANVAGTFLATQYGALMSKPLQATNALIVTKKVGGIKAINSSTATTTNTGLAVYPGLSPYRKNQIALDTQSIPENAEIDETIISQIIPTKGALILADFKARQGYKLLLTLDGDGQSIPMGAKAIFDENKTAMVASFNQVYMLSEQEKGQVNVNWTVNGQEKSCTAQFDLTKTEAVNGLYLIKTACVDQQTTPHTVQH
ncbi:fimbria/pilus outer membrane usher protein [Acinetobacter rudis]|uniref:Fimbria/pilus outer membrane usher protein n=1 Tax=Acinetobacter rudis TaxID=632955 RepID=A0AAW8JD99_9GAMM|nr:fimbria/pilus outer membrane usher protein [Acinetobacter rudis]MDQ8937076.1 fimbria/pilus outer membrane usher protein [Acinetobacter rudis]MDQ9019270.1 fimbria/pilus outer membrane usher protein [Acinetobacter rudis]